MNHNRKHRTSIMLLFVVLLCIILGSTVYLGDYYRTDEDMVAVFVAESDMVYRVCEDGMIVWEPEHALEGLIFYPGGKVEHTAYIPLMQACAEQNILCVLVEMPFHLAVFDIDAADGIQEQYPQIEKWYIGGHSLGGAMAASYVSEHADAYEGLILLGAYSASDLKGTDLKALSVFGSEDQVMDREKYEENRKNLPDDFTEAVIDGGCHAYFGMYGAQEGDGTPAICCEDQIWETAAFIGSFMNKKVE